VTTKSPVKNAILSSFPELPLPHSIINLATGDIETRGEIRAALEAKRWPEIPKEVLCFHHDAPFFLSPDGFRYLLPAFLIAALESPTSPLVDTLVFALTMPDAADDAQLFLDTMSPLNDSQRSAVRLFLEYLRDEEAKDWPDDAPGRALQRYWAA
jgi:hypothetical protein